MTTVINGSDNSASTPALTGTDTDTGVFFPSANNMALSTGGTERMRVDSSGNVGIGTSSPQSTIGVNVALNDTKGVVLQYNGDAKAGMLVNPISGEVKFGSINSNGTYFTTFYANNAERMRITSDGYLRMASGSGGIQFGGDTAAANALDDYEEGTWTPTDVSGAGLSFSTATGTYTKIGRMIYASTHIVYPSTANGTTALIGGLPFTLPATNVVRQGFISYANASVVARALPEDGQTRFDIRKTDGTNVTNSELSGKTLFAMLIYYV